MSVHKETFGSREEWLAHRRLGGSDISIAAGMNHWKTNVQLWREKSGLVKPDEVSNEFVIYGTKAEEFIRDLFALDFPEYEIFYEPNNLWTNDKYPYASASLDGWLSDENGRLGVLEIKTASISSGRAADQWKGKIPDYYLAQLLWNMMVTEAGFGILVAQLKYEIDGDMYKITRHYFVEGGWHQADFEFLQAEGEKFWRCVEEGREPALKLPEL